MMHWREPRQRSINAQEAMRAARCDLPLRSVTPQALSLAAILLAAVVWASICLLAGAP